MGVPGVTVLSIFLRILFDQLCVSPYMNGCILFLDSLLRTRSFVAAWMKLKHDFKATMLRSYILWPAAHIITYSGQLGPTTQVAYVNSVAFLWMLYLAAVATRPVARPVLTAVEPPSLLHPKHAVV
eukprot:NODE_4903_length_440_cov_63.746803_g4243_i0.p1 GENE.NODE_4903_length_440_cov_63.746803_g4243_i0~~NODE_4903_length_440_cov_63.746803_g4243_i0.p1  ORF type:complete len:126 (-),score=29.02 NODE_4903_length_440_cov_63.746803_g4243_i0:31-408(-)